LDLAGLAVRSLAWLHGYMPKRTSKKVKDPNQIAAAVVAVHTSEESQIDRETLSRVMAETGRKGGKIGGKRGLKTMSAADRKKRASKAAKAHWKKRK
jgi:hypothetical protein